MEDPNLIATLIPVGDLTKYELSRVENEGRCLLSDGVYDDEPVIGSREATPAYVSPQKEDNYEKIYRLPLKLGDALKDPTQGYAFGTSKQRCDVVLALRGVRGTSGVHFHITFDVIKGETRLVLRDFSTNGTAVSYDGQAENEVRHKFTWILDLKKCDRDGETTATWKIRVHVRGLEFKVELATHDTCVVDYDKNVTELLKLSHTADPPVSGMGLHSPTELPSQYLSPGKRPVYISEGDIGKGSFGKVDRVIDVSTGAIYARKTFFDPGKHERERWLDHICREIRIMKEHPHEHIVGLVDAQEEMPPFLVMPYLHLGNLRDENSRLPLTDEDFIDLLSQGLSVLEHLHSRGVAHRDLKPDNILVESRSPLLVRFTDFGLANDQHDLRTFCGSEQYAAPEIFSGESYTKAVDIWSLGVIVLEYVYGLPTRRSQARTNGVAAIRQRGLAWCHSLVKSANDWESDRLIDLIVTGMLRIEPRERLVATACLRKGYELGVFKESSVGSGHATPTQTGSPASAVCNEEETPTITGGALWNANRAPANSNDDNDDDNDQEKRSDSEGHSRTSTSQLEGPALRNKEGISRARKATPKVISDHSSVHARSSGEVPHPRKVGSINARSKRHRSSAASPISSPSDRSRVKRRPPEDRPTRASSEPHGKVSS